MSSVGDRIRRARQEKGISQEELARLIYTTKSTISKYELGKREPRLETLQNIADVLGVSSFYLVGPDRLIIGDQPNQVPINLVSDEALLPEEVIKRIITSPDPSFDGLRERIYDAALSIKTELFPGEHLRNDSLCQIEELFDILNDNGVRMAVERVEELTEIPKYRRDTETPPEAPDGPPEAK